MLGQRLSGGGAGPRPTLRRRAPHGAPDAIFEGAPFIPEVPAEPLNDKIADFRFLFLGFGFLFFVDFYKHSRRQRPVKAKDEFGIVWDRKSGRRRSHEYRTQNRAEHQMRIFQKEIMVREPIKILRSVIVNVSVTSMTRGPLI